MNLIETLREQETFNFTGRINILHKDSGQFLGVIFQEEGEIINAQFRNIVGKKALLQIGMEDGRKNNRLRYVVEPEVIEDADRRFQIDMNDFEKIVSQARKQSEHSQKLKPPEHIKLGICPEFISKGENISAEEFDLLATVTEYQRVGEIYENSALLEYQVTNALVELRRKGALKVLAGAPSS